jgi:hypothetical protein
LHIWSAYWDVSMDNSTVSCLTCFAVQLGGPIPYYLAGVLHIWLLTHNIWFLWTGGSLSKFTRHNTADGQWIRAWKLQNKLWRHGCEGLPKRCEENQQRGEIHCGMVSTQLFSWSETTRKIASFCPCQRYAAGTTSWTFSWWLYCPQERFCRDGAGSCIGIGSVHNAVV